MKFESSMIHSVVARRIFLLFVICAILPVCLMALLSLQKVTSSLDQESHDRLRQIGKNAGMSIHEGLTLLQAELESTPISETDAHSAISRSTNNWIGERRFRRVFVTSYERVIDNSIRERPLSAEERRHLEVGNAVIIAPHDLDADDPAYMVTAKNSNLAPRSLMVGEINPAYLWTLVERTLPASVGICVLGPSGRHLYTTFQIPAELPSEVFSHEKSSSVGHFDSHWNNENHLVNYWSVFLKPIFMADSWTVVAVQSRSAAVGTVRTFIHSFLLTILLAIFVVILISSYLVRKSLVPLSILKTGAQRISQGDFSTQVEVTSGDEFEDLAVSFNEMSKQLGKQFTRLGEMGRLVQKILAAHDRDTLIDAVFSSFRNLVPCEWLAISQQDGKVPTNFTVFYDHSSSIAPSKVHQFDAQLSAADLASIRRESEYIRVKGTESYHSLLSSLAAQGAMDFYLFPISIKDRLLGILTLGFVQAPDIFQEELVRAAHIADEIAIALENVRLIDELNLLNWGTIQTLANAVDAKSPWTAGHSERVTRLALEIGREMGLCKAELDLLHWGGLFHDIGKIGIPENVLDKQCRLTEEEFALIKKHPIKGAEILAPISAYRQAIPIVSQHHERFDGLGYPHGIAGEEIFLGARILSVADVFDALFSDRPYRSGWELDKVISYLEENAGSCFDPEVVKAFLLIDRDFYLAPHSGERVLISY